MPRLEAVPADIRERAAFLSHAANFVVCALIHLEGNVSLKRKLRFGDVRNRPVGHWGTCPGINAILASAYSVCETWHEPARIVVGTGHAGPALAACQFLTGRLAPRYPTTLEGLERLVAEFAGPCSLDSEISPSYPETIYCGGELGGALAFSQGNVFGAASTTTICVLGDGELETALTRGSWQGFDFLGVRDGTCIPVINANGFRMGSMSLHSLMRDERFELWAKSHDLRVFHARETDALCDALAHIHRQSQTASRERPIVVFSSPKGWSGPERLKGEPFAGTDRSHKTVLQNAAKDPAELGELEHWLNSYDPETIIARISSGRPDDTGSLQSDRPGQRRASRSKDIVPGVPPPSNNPMRVLEACIEAYMVDDEELLLFSPDELKSNRLGNLADRFGMRWPESNANDGRLRPSGRIVEILSEQVCFAWMQGYAATGRPSLLVSYEGFATLMLSQLVQLLKFLRRYPQEHAEFGSMTIILTSPGWQNCPSHHSPMLMDALVSVDSPDLSIFTPYCQADIVGAFARSVATSNHVSVLMLSKRDYLQLAHCADPGEYRSWRLLVDPPAVDVTLVAIGDLMVEQCLMAASQSTFDIRVISITDVGVALCFDDSAPERIRLERELALGSGCVWVYNGSRNAILSRLWGRRSERDRVVGYRGIDDTPSGDERLAANGVDAESILMLVKEMVARNRRPVS